MFVDHHAHWFPPAYFEFVEHRRKAPRSERIDGGWRWIADEEAGGDWTYGSSFLDLESNVADMEAAGVDVSLITAVMMGDVLHLDLGLARETLDLLHEEIAGAQRRYDGKVRGLAMLPLQDTDASLEVLEATVAEGSFSGVCITTHLGDGSIAPPRLLPLYKRIEELGVPIYLHPPARSGVFDCSVEPASEGSRAGRLLEIGLAWVYDTSLAALALIFNGVLDECPNLKVVHPHTGGVIPFVRERIARSLEYPGTRSEYKLQRSVDEYLADNFYIDFASGSTASMIGLGAQTYGRAHVVLGSDYPYVPRPQYIDLMNELEPDFAAEIRANQIPLDSLG